MSSFKTAALLVLSGTLSALSVVAAPPGVGFGQAPAARIPGYTPPSRFPSTIGLRPTTSGFTGINPGALPTRFGYGNRSGASPFLPGRVPSIRGRDYRRLPVGYFFAPYYYPGLLYGRDDFDYGEPGSTPLYGGLDPVTDNLAAGQGALSREIQQLSAQVDQLQQLQLSTQPVPTGQPAAVSREASEPDRPPVVLVLRDGQQLKVKSFAVMAGVFWDFTSPVAKKIPLASIDVSTSARLTEAQGGEFPQLGQ
jgi:hypothetical protein